MNDYRGILPRPNVFFESWHDGATGARGIGIFSGKYPIKSGTELCITYGRGFWAARAPPEEATTTMVL